MQVTSVHSVRCSDCIIRQNLEERVVKVEREKRLRKIAEELLDNGSDVTRLRVGKVQIAAFDTTLSKMRNN